MQILSFLPFPRSAFLFSALLHPSLSLYLFCFSCHLFLFHYSIAIFSLFTNKRLTYLPPYCLFCFYFLTFECASLYFALAFLPDSVFLSFTLISKFPTLIFAFLAIFHAFHSGFSSLSLYLTLSFNFSLSLLHFAFLLTFLHHSLLL